jgi:hypothetical protein
MTTRVGSVAVFRNLPVLASLDDKVAPGEEILAYPYCPIYYFLSATTNPTRYGGLMYDFNTPSQFEEVVRVLGQRRVKYVVWDTNFQTTVVTNTFPSAKPMRPEELIIEPYLESRYKLVKEEDGVRLLERKLEQNDEANANRKLNTPHETPNLAVPLTLAGAKN